MHCDVFYIIIFSLNVCNFFSHIHKIFSWDSQSFSTFYNHWCFVFDDIFQNIGQDNSVIFQQLMKKLINVWIHIIVVCEHCHKQKFWSIILLIITINAKIMFKILILFFNLFINLWMKCDVKFTLRIQKSTQGFSKFACEQEFLIEYNNTHHVIMTYKLAL